MVIPCLEKSKERRNIIENAINVDGEIAYQYKYNPNYYITKTGILYSVLVKGGQGRTDITNPRKVCYGQDRDGYYRVVLSNHGEKTYIKIHQIVAKQFLGDVNPPYVVNHKDGNKHNNSVDNLEIITDKENIYHAWENGLINKYKNPFRVRIDVYDHVTCQLYHFFSIADTIKECKIGWRYIDKIRKNIIEFGDCIFKKRITGKGRYDYCVDCYHNGQLFRTFPGVKEAGRFFNRPGNSVSGAFKATYPLKVNRYTLTFPNVSTIES